MRTVLVFSVLVLAGCGFLRRGGDRPAAYPLVSYEEVHERSGGLHPPDHCALARWDDQYYYFEWRRVVEPATMKTVEGSGKVPVEEFDRKNGTGLERSPGIIGKEDLSRQLYNAGVP